jgi:hypothetical protein
VDPARELVPGAVEENGVIEEPPSQDAHVVAANKVFRDVGFTLAAIQWPRPLEALAALRKFNRVPDTWVEPFGWRYFPNEWLRDNWRLTYPEN